MLTVGSTVLLELFSLPFSEEEEKLGVKLGGAETCVDRPAGPLARTPLNLRRRSPLGLLITALEQSKLPKTGKSYLRERKMLHTGDTYYLYVCG